MTTHRIPLIPEPLESLTPRPFDESLEVPLKWALTMNPQSYRFYPLETLAYFDNFTLFFVKYTSSFLPPTYDQQENRQHVRIPLPKEKGFPNFKKIQIISIYPQNMVLVGFTNSFSLYRWTTGEFIFEFSLPGSEESIEWISNPEQVNRNCSFVTINTSTQAYILKIEYWREIHVQFYVLERPSLFKSITSLFKASAIPADSKSHTFMIPNREGMFSLIISNSNWILFRLNENQQTFRKQWQKPVTKLKSNQKITDFIIESSEKYNSFHLIVYLLIREANSSTKIRRVEIDMDDCQSKEEEISLNGDSLSYFGMNIHNKVLYVVRNSFNNKQGLLYLFNIERGLVPEGEEALASNVVLGDRIIITQSRIYNYLESGKESRQDMDVSRDNQFVEEGSYLRNKESASVLKEVERVSRPSTKLENILMYEESDHELIREQIQGQIQELQAIVRKSTESANPQEIVKCVKEVLFKHIQYLIVSDLSDSTLHNILSEYFKPRYVEQFFKSTEEVLDVLSTIATSKLFLYFSKLIESSFDKLRLFKSLPNYEQCRKQFTGSIFPILLECSDRLEEEGRSYSQTQKLKELMEMFGESDKRYFDYLFSCENYKQYYQLCLKHSFDLGIINLYVETNFLSAGQLKSYIRTQASPNFIHQLTVEYFDYISERKVERLKLLIDLPEHILQIHEIIENKYPVYSWITALKTQNSISYLKNKASNILATQPINYRTILSLQNDGTHNTTLNLKNQIVTVCEKLGWNCVTGQQLLSIIQSKGQQQIQQIISKLHPHSIDLVKLMQSIQIQSQ